MTSNTKLLTTLPSPVVSDKKGNLFDIPEYGLLVRSGGSFVTPQKQDLIELPLGSDLHMLPDRYPVCIDGKSGRVVTLKSYRGMKVFAASAFLAPAHTALYLAAFRSPGRAVPLPLFAYAPLGFQNERFVTAAIRTDKDVRQDCDRFDQEEVIRRGRRLLKKYKKNRLVAHLIQNCAFLYLCPAARNWVMGRWEAPIPVSIGCNAACRGCISLQPEDSGVPATQERLTFIPTAQEIVEYTVPHLDFAERAVVSFGQGCEGEPLTQAALIEESVLEMRKRTKKGTINLNTNASIPDAVERICKAGLDSIRVSLNSLQAVYYDGYFKPNGYCLEDVIESIGIAKRLGLWVSLNYFIFPGLTDSRDEMEKMKKLLKKIAVDMIQMRNLNMDPDSYWSELRLGKTGEGSIGIRRWMEEVKRLRPTIRFGYFNPFISHH